jgi:hypothetical protein
MFSVPLSELVFSLFKPSQDLERSYVWLTDKKLIPLKKLWILFKNVKRNNVSKDSTNLL